MTYVDIPLRVEGSTEGTPRGCRRPRGVSPRLIPTHEVGITHELEVESFGVTLSEARSADPYDMREAPLGMLVAYTHITPRDDCPIQKVMAPARLQHPQRPLAVPDVSKADAVLLPWEVLVCLCPAAQQQ